MASQHNIKDLLKDMSPALHDEVYVYASYNGEIDLGNAVMIFHEEEGDTAIITRDCANLNGLDWNFPCRMITLRVYSALDAVGFLSIILPTLARRGIATNVVSGYHHDHLFVPEDRAIDALEALKALSAGVD